MLRHWLQPRWSWSYVLGKQQGRKPAIKRPARHQWLYCNPNFDPHHPLPPKMLTPYTPPTNLTQDEWQTYRNLKQTHRQPSAERYRQKFVRWLALRDLDWRTAFTEVWKLHRRRTWMSGLPVHADRCFCALIPCSNSCTKQEHLAHTYIQSMLPVHADSTTSGRNACLLEHESGKIAAKIVVNLPASAVILAGSVYLLCLTS